MEFNGGMELPNLSFVSQCLIVDHANSLKYTIHLNEKGA